jgi:molecular chaperone GrpE
MEENQKEETHQEEHQLPVTEETIRELQSKIQELERQNEQYLESLKRAKADVLRLEKEYQEKADLMVNMANANLIYSLLSVLDSFELALKKEKEDNPYLQGFYLIYSQFKDILQKFGLQEINPLKQKFNPQFHEAISHKKCETENCVGDDEGLIIEVLSLGYLFKGQVLRPARVKVITHE